MRPRAAPRSQAKHNVLRSWFDAQAIWDVQKARTWGGEGEKLPRAATVDLGVSAYAKAHRKIEKYLQIHTVPYFPRALERAGEGVSISDSDSDSEGPDDE